MFKQWSQSLPNRERPIVILDRDGVLCENTSSAHKPLQPIPGAALALAELHAAGYTLLIVSNQSAVGRGSISLQTMLDRHKRFLSLIDATRQNIQASIICPHSPDVNCSCRKPGTQGIDDYLEIHGLARSQIQWFVGDKLSDVSCGDRLQVKTILVLTGHGQRELESLRGAPSSARPTYIASNIETAVKHILKYDS